MLAALRDHPAMTGYHQMLSWDTNRQYFRLINYIFYLSYFSRSSASMANGDLVGVMNHPG
jgi:hypothetical protein